MSTFRMLPRRARWAVPAAAVGLAGAVAAGLLIAQAQATPELPARSAAQLLAAVSGRQGVLPPLTGTVVETASLGIPQIPGMDNPRNIVSLLSGSHTLRVWYGGPTQVRLAVPVQLGETDLIRNGQTAWLWESSSNSATRFLLRHRGVMPGQEPVPSPLPLTPQQAARQALAAVGATTRVGMQRNVTVAGQAAYQLVLSPKDSRSLIGRVTIAVDAAHNVPLRVQVFARDASSPAFQVGYTSIAFARPAAANFAFTPPPGATTRTVSLPGSRMTHWTGLPDGQLRLIGHDWLTVAVLPASMLPAGGNVASAAGESARSIAGAPGGPGGNGVSAPILGAMLHAAPRVHGSWGSGRLLRSSLVSVLVTSSGQVLAGAVDPSVLYSVAAQLK